MQGTIRIQVGHKHHARWLRGALPSDCHVVQAQRAMPEDAHAFDLCVLDATAFAQARELVRGWKRAVAPVYLPVVLVCDAPQSTRLDEEVWEELDGVIVLPVSKAELASRLRSLLFTREVSIQLQQRQQELAAQRLGDESRLLRMALLDLAVPLWSLDWRAQQLCAEGFAPLDATHRPDAQGLRTCTQSIHRLVARLTDAVCSGAGGLPLVRSTVDLVALAKEALCQQEGLAALSQRELRYQGPSGGVLCEVDPLRFRQMLELLLLCALRSAAGPGPIDLIVTSEHPSTQLLLHVTETSAAKASRAASSCGPSPVQQSMAFWMAKQLAEAHGTSLELQETPIARVFSLTLPSVRRRPEAPLPTTHLTRSLPARPAKRIG